ncbi:uncharacterized protein LOC130798221 [Amaranthus tricolor]|uniref:uncharacterized protein LOC130798221 n=1 Tax=Amaranthus tricolor TaxID=29722 RepID=UPI002589AEE7|nr:uncharacterized protein LOC130798221 [Amaranthus tricolor]
MDSSLQSSQATMKNHQFPAQHHRCWSGTRLFSRLDTNPRFSVAVIIVLYVIILAMSYSLGYLVGSSFTIKDITTFVISRTPPPPSRNVVLRLSEPLSYKFVSQCAEPVPPEFVRQTIIDQVYNGKSPYEDFIPVRATSSSLLTKKVQWWGSYEVIYKSLIHKVRPKTIIKFGSSLGASAAYIANLTSELGLETQILGLNEFRSLSVFRGLSEDIAMPNGDSVLLNQFIHDVISQNVKESVLPVPLAMNSDSEKLCEWGIYGDLIEVDAGRDFHSAWSEINKAYKLLRPGGVLFGHNYFSSYNDIGAKQAVRLFARANKFLIEEDQHHWMMVNSAYK